MGLFDSIKSLATTALDYTAGAFTNPIKLVSQGPTAAKNAFVETNARGLSGQIENTLRTVGTAATASALLLSGGAALGSTSAKSIGSKAITYVAQPIIKAVTTFPKTAATAAAVTLFATKSETVAQALKSTPSSVNQFASNVGKTIDNPTLSNAAKIATDNPIISSIVAGAAVLATGKIATNAYSSYQTYANTQAIQANNAIMQAQTLAPKDLGGGFGMQEISDYTPLLPVETSQYIPAPLSSAEVVAPLAPSKVVEVAPSAGPKTTKKKKKKATKKKKTTTKKKKTTKKKTRRSKKKKNIKRKGAKK